MTSIEAYKGEIINYVTDSTEYEFLKILYSVIFFHSIGENSSTNVDESTHYQGKNEDSATYEDESVTKPTIR